MGSIKNIFYLSLMMFVCLMACNNPLNALPKKPYVYNIIIIGSGPAGLTAGMYAARAKLDPLIIEGKNPNGQLINAPKIENWPGAQSITGLEAMTNLREHAQKFGTQFLSAHVTKVDFSQKPFSIWTDNNTELKTNSVIIATGTQPKKLCCPGEKQYWGKGIAACATCDAPFYRDKQVIVVGSGKTALRNISLLKKFTPKITIVESKNKLSLPDPDILSDPKIKIIYNSTVSEIQGDTQRVSGAVITNKLTGATHNLKTDGIFVAIGVEASTAPFSNQLELNGNGYIKVKNNTHTSIPGVFAAGTVFDYIYKQAITCVASGCMAALDAQRYLNLMNKENNQQ